MNSPKIVVATFFVTTLLAINSFSQSKIVLNLKSGMETFFANEKPTLSFDSHELTVGYAYRIVSVSTLNLNKDLLKARGVELLGYLPENSFYAKIQVENTHLPEEFISVFEINSRRKQSPEVYAGYFPDYAKDGNFISINLSVFDGEMDAVRSEIGKIASAKIESESPSSISVKIPSTSLNNVLALRGVYYICSIDALPEPLNTPGKTSHGSSVLDGYTGNGVKYTGNGITVMMTDDGLLNEHIDFKNRFDQSECSICDPLPSASHGDHVAGTIMGAGNKDPYTRGMAKDINFFVQDAATGFGAFWNVVPTKYTTDSLVITSRSYGNGCGGTYSAVSSDFDEQMIALPNILHVVAAANSGTSNCGYGVSGWGNISDGEQPAKNPLVVGALTDYDVIAGFSSRGPLKDGRIKPDVCGVGVNVLSTQPGNQYASFNGTSMSTPGVSGTIAQLYEAFKDHNGGNYPTGALMKAIVMNTANDLGTKGPDFIHGYGKINARKAYRTIKDGTYFTSSLSNGANESFFISVPPNVSELRIMLYWADPEAVSAANPALVNDLNLSVINPNSTTILPWVLDHTPSIPALSSPATPGVDSINNVEQVTIDGPTAGTYEVNVDGFSIPVGPQTYYIVYEFNYNEINVNYPNGEESFNSPSSTIIRWDAMTDNSDFLVEYTLDNGNSWNNIGTANPSARHINWNIPSGISTGEARIRVSKPGISDVSDTTFSIFNRPVGLSFNWSCPDSLSFAWNPVNGASHYTVYMLGNKFMDSIGMTADTFMVVNVPATDTNWFSVRSHGFSGQVSERAIAIQKLPGEFNCTWSAPHAGVDPGCVPTNVNGCVDFTNASVNTTASSTYTWYFPSGTPSTSSAINPTVCFSGPGYHDIALVVDNGVGIDSVYYTNFIYIDSAYSLPYHEGFENIGTFAGNDFWTVINNGGAAFFITGTAALSGSQSVRLNNHGQQDGSIDELISGPIDASVLGSSDLLTLSFRYSYRRINSSSADRLKLFVNSECDENWIVRKTLSGTMLSNDPPSTQPWVPSSSSDWVTVHVTNITSQFFTGEFQFKFQFENGGGSNFFLDDINIYQGSPSDTVVSGVVENNMDHSMAVYPNPASDEVNVLFKSETGVPVTILITDITGKTIQSNHIQSGIGQNLVVFNTNELATGSYFVILRSGTSQSVERLIIE